MKYIISILFLLFISKAYSFPKEVNLDGTLKHSTSCLFEDDQVGSFVYSAVIDDDSETSDGPEADLCTTATQNGYIAVARQAEFIAPVCTLHTIRFITPLFIDLPPPVVTLVR